MARGYIYEVNTDVHDNHNMTESDFYDYGSEADYFLDIKNPNQEIESLLNRLEEAGCTINRTKQSFIITDDARKAFFADRYKEFMKLTKNMTLDEFTDSSKAYTLSTLINNTYTDAVYVEQIFLTLDGFMREGVMTDTEYYIGNVVLMH